MWYVCTHKYMSICIHVCLCTKSSSHQVFSSVALHFGTWSTLTQLGWVLSESLGPPIFTSPALRFHKCAAVLSFLYVCVSMCTCGTQNPEETIRSLSYKELFAEYQLVMLVLRSCHRDCKPVNLTC